MGCACAKRSSEEEYFSDFWNSLNLAKITPDQILTKVDQLKNEKQEVFLKNLEMLFIDAYMKNEEFKKTIEYFRYDHLVLGSPFKTLVVFFSLLLFSSCHTEKEFNDNFQKFYVLCSQSMDVSHLDINSESFVREAVIFYVQLVSMQTHKAFVYAFDGKNFTNNQEECKLFFSQKIRDEFINTLFIVFEKQEFSLLKFLEFNFKALQHDKIRTRLREISSTKNISNTFRGPKA